MQPENSDAPQGVGEQFEDEHRPNPALVQMVLTRLREFTRRPEAVFWVYIFPILMMLVLGSAFRSKPVERIVVDVENSLRDREANSSAVLAADAVDAGWSLDSQNWQDQLQEILQADERLKIRFLDPEECRRRLKTGKSELFVRVHTGSGGFSYVYDPTRPGSVVAREAVDEVLQVHAGRRAAVATRSVEFSEPGGRYIDWLIPGLLGMGLMGGGLWGVGFAITDMRIRKLLKRFLATPMSRSQFLFAIMVSRLIFMVPEMVLLLVVAWLIFGVQVYGSWLAVVFLILLGATQFSGIGLLVASRARTMETVSGLMNLIMLPMWTLSGIFFSYERYPEITWPLIRALPLTPLIDSLRAVMNEGTPLWELWPQLAVMSVWTLVTFAIALRIFRWGD